MRCALFSAHLTETVPRDRTNRKFNFHDHDCATARPRARLHHAIAVDSSCGQPYRHRPCPDRQGARCVVSEQIFANLRLAFSHFPTPGSVAVNVLLYGHCLSVAGMSKTNGGLSSYVLVCFVGFSSFRLTRTLGGFVRHRAISTLIGIFCRETRMSASFGPGGQESHFGQRLISSGVRNAHSRQFPATV